MKLDEVSKEQGGIEKKLLDDDVNNIVIMKFKSGKVGLFEKKYSCKYENKVHELIIDLLFNSWLSDLEVMTEAIIWRNKTVSFRRVTCR